jgi:hypothetical protein
MIPVQAVSANKVHFDLFNATGSGITLKILGDWWIANLGAAGTGFVSVRLYLTRTTAVSTIGTAATTEGTSLTAVTVCKMNPNDSALNANVTARAAPGGGATAGA